jgi:group I intron endonuclease
MGYLYLIRNSIDNMVYIGITQQKKLSVRINQHKSNAKCAPESSPLAIAINEYGWDNFSVDIVLESNDPNELQVAEIECVSKYKDRCYNRTKGGELKPAGKGKYPHSLSFRFRPQDKPIWEFIDTYSSTKGIDRSTTIRILLEYGITLALQEMYEESD